MDQGSFGKVDLPLPERCLHEWVHKSCVQRCDPMGTGGAAASGGVNHLTCGSF